MWLSKDNLSRGQADVFWARLDNVHQLHIFDHIELTQQCSSTTMSTYMYI